MSNYGNPRWLFRLMVRCEPGLQYEYDLCRASGFSYKDIVERIFSVYDCMGFERHAFGKTFGKPLASEFTDVPVVMDKDIDFSEIGGRVVWMPDLKEFRFVEND